MFQLKCGLRMAVEAPPKLPSSVRTALPCSQVERLEHMSYVPANQNIYKVIGPSSTAAKLSPFKQVKIVVLDDHIVIHCLRSWAVCELTSTLYPQIHFETVL